MKNVKFTVLFYVEPCFQTYGHKKFKALFDPIDSIFNISRIHIDD